MTDRRAINVAVSDSILPLILVVKHRTPQDRGSKVVGAPKHGHRFTDSSDFMQRWSGEYSKGHPRMMRGWLPHSRDSPLRLGPSIISSHLLASVYLLPLRGVHAVLSVVFAYKPFIQSNQPRKGNSCWDGMSEVFPCWSNNRFCSVFNS
jgi:hypothetical protein